MLCGCEGRCAAAVAAQGGSVTEGMGIEIGVENEAGDGSSAATPASEVEESEFGRTTSSETSSDPTETGAETLLSALCNGSSSLDRVEVVLRRDVR